MDYRQLGASGLQVSALSFGTATFGGKTKFFRAWGNTQLGEATRLIDVALEAGVNLFDTADGYSDGMAEDILGQALGLRRREILISTKAGYASEPGPNGLGSSRHHLIKACEASLRRLRTDYIDLYHLHAFDALTSVEETLRALDDLVRSGKVRYVACSNFSGWHLMKALAVSERYGLPRHVAHQAHYSLASREYEWELMPLALDQNVGTLVWSPLAGGLLTGKIRRNQIPAEQTRAASKHIGVEADREVVFRVLDAMDEVAKDTGKTLPQIAVNWLMRRPTVASVIIGARNEAQLRDTLGAGGWNLSDEHNAKLNAASDKTPIYPYWHQRSTFSERNPIP